MGGRGEGRREGAAGVLLAHWLGSPGLHPGSSILQGEAEAVGSNHRGQHHTEFLRCSVDPATPMGKMD